MQQSQENNRRLLREALPNLAPGYGDSAHDKAAERLARDMEPGFTFTVDRYEPDDDETGHRLIVNSNATAHNVGEAASLLEAAPCMFAALEDAIHYLDQPMQGETEYGACVRKDKLAAARAALARAKGGAA